MVRKKKEKIEWEKASAKYIVAECERANAVLMICIFMIIVFQ